MSGPNKPAQTRFIYGAFAWIWVLAMLSLYLGSQWPTLDLIISFVTNRLA